MFDWAAREPCMVPFPPRILLRLPDALTGCSSMSIYDMLVSCNRTPDTVLVQQQYQPRRQRTLVCYKLSFSSIDNSLSEHDSHWYVTVPCWPTLATASPSVLDAGFVSSLCLHHIDTHHGTNEPPTDPTFACCSDQPHNNQVPP